MVTKHVVVVPYDEAWKKDFVEIKKEIQDALGDLALSIEHVGSTSVEELSAKPIIDIDVVIKDYSVLDEVVDALGKIGYEHEGNLGIDGREAFKYEGKDHLRLHHLYVCPLDSAELKRHLAFRDFLRSHKDAVREYSRVKEEGAALYPYDIEKYIEYKSPFIEKIYAQLGQVTIEEIPVERIDEFWNIHFKYLVDDGIITDDEDKEYFSGDEYRGIIKAHMLREDDRHHMVYFVLDGKRVGAAQYNTYIKENGKCFVLDFWVFSEYRNDGLGHRCFTALELYTKADGARYYEINSEKEDSIRFWKSLGFVENGKDEYEAPVFVRC